MNWQNKSVSQLKQSVTPCIDDHQLKKEDFDVVGELASVSAQIVFKCLYLARTSRPVKLMSCIHGTVGNGQYCYDDDQFENCKLGLFQDASFSGDLQDSKS